MAVGTFTSSVRPSSAGAGGEQATAVAADCSIRTIDKTLAPNLGLIRVIVFHPLLLAGWIEQVAHSHVPQY